MPKTKKLIEKLDTSLGELRNEFSDLKVELEDKISSLEKEVENRRGKNDQLAKLQKRIDKLADNLKNQQNSLEKIENEQNELEDWVSKLDTEVNENNIFRRRITDEDTEKFLPEKCKNE